MKYIFYPLIALAALIFAAGTYITWLILAPLPSDQIVLRIQKGDNARVIASKLAENRIIRNKDLFILIARQRGTDRKLHSGAYSFGGNYNLLQTVKMLEEGNTDAIRVTIPEGFSLYRTLQRLDRSGLADYDRLMALATDPVFAKRLTGMPVNTLEGFIFPETYSFEIGISPDSLLAIPVREFFSRVRGSGVDPHTMPDFYDKLVLASIVEKESAHPDERVLIAGVFLNRLKRNMRLESCPTVDYLLERQGIKRKVLTHADINTPSPYNTYMNGGLPPGPICNPSLESLQAVINPIQTDYIFFVSDRNGRNDFSVTYNEHLRKKRLYSR